MLKRLALLLPIALTAALAVTAPPAAAATRHPVLFVHGFSGFPANWDSLYLRFRAAGYPASHLTKWSYDSFQANTTTARQVAAKVAEIKQQTGAAKVDVVTHSMGGLSTRYYLKSLGGTAHVDDWVSIGGPNHGTGFAYACFIASCADMRFGSALLTGLNSGDETPGSTSYTTFWSPCDEIINPDSSVVLAGAVNNGTACLGHLGLLASWSVGSGVLDAVR